VQAWSERLWESDRLLRTDHAKKVNRSHIPTDFRRAYRISRVTMNVIDLGKFGTMAAAVINNDLS
jgi:hypothetical protein